MLVVAWPRRAKPARPVAAAAKLVIHRQWPLSPWKYISYVFEQFNFPFRI